MRIGCGSALLLLISEADRGFHIRITSRVFIMFSSADVRAASAALPTGSGRGLLRWVSTSNPFYVLSAGLFLAGLWISFGTQYEEVQTWALMSGLAGYTLLLAATACLLVRFGNVWDDVRTLLLLVVLMFLATSVTFDEVLVFDPARGYFCYIIGLLFAIGVSEGLLRGIRLALPVLFRVPYYLILSLFFLYPLALRPLLADPHGEALLWGLFGFSPIAGVFFLTLLPAIRRGPDYVRDNGSPWCWPLYPWVLFGVLAFVVPARAFLLCWSMQLLESSEIQRVLFGPFFAAPFGLAVAVLLLESGIVAKARTVQWTALTIPLVLIGLTFFCHRDDPIYRHFLDVFTARVGDPLSVLLLATALFFAYAVWRRISLSSDALTAVLVLLAVVGPNTLDNHELGAPQSTPFLAAALLQMALGVEWRHSWRCLAGTVFLIAALVTLPQEVLALFPVGAVALHLALLSALMIGALFNDVLARLLRLFASVVILLVCDAVILGRPQVGESIPPILLLLYPLVMAALLAGYGRLLGQRFPLPVAFLIVAAWLGMAGWRGYCWLRQRILGLDHLLVSLALFALAVLVSLGKAGVLPRRLSASRQR